MKASIPEARCRLAMVTPTGNHSEIPVTIRTSQPIDSATSSSKAVGPLGPTVCRKIRVETWEATWGEFDLDKAVWSIPAIRMKTKEAHVVPLAPAAVKLLRSIHRRHH
jgi:hypothetical protein